MTKQEIFDTVAPALLKQGERCGKYTDLGFQCMYEHLGKRCAVGFLIPDGHPALALQDTVFGLTIEFPELGFKPFLDIFRDLQDIHGQDEPGDWKLKLLVLAEKYHLSTECINDV